MGRFGIVLGFVLLSSLMFLAEGLLRDGTPTRILGMPAVGAGTGSLNVDSSSSSGSDSDDDIQPAVASDNPPAWLAGGGEGVLVLGAGVGLVELGIGGVGLLFAVGQASAGLIAVGQACFGLVFFVGQLGFGGSGVGQLAVGGLVEGQGRLGGDGEEFLARMNKDIGGLLTFFWGKPP